MVVHHSNSSVNFKSKQTININILFQSSNNGIESVTGRQREYGHENGKECERGRTREKRVRDGENIYKERTCERERERMGEKEERGRD